MKLNDICNGFRLKSIEPIEELDMTAYRFYHERSGADLLWLSVDDENRAFSIGFKTIPTDSTGVFHILEHSVLCGSKKFPLKEPFVDLLKGSLQTFLNAMTFPDKTIYPVASTNEKDFMNLMDVYMDAVLNPRIYDTEEIFMQEGWHYTPGCDGDNGSFSGVVYNEMKGVYSSPDSVMYDSMQNELLKDTCYGFSSGGNPPDIIHLTYRDYLNTHARFYHPENSYIYLYGKMDIEEKLAFLDGEYLCHYEKMGNHFDVTKQPALGDRTVYKTYEIADGEPTEGNSMIARSVMLCDFSDRKTQIGMRLLLTALTATNEAPLKRAMLEANIGDEFSAWVDDGIYQPYLTFYLKKTGAEHLEAFNRVLQTTLAKLADEGIDRTVMEATINRFDFSLREKSATGTASGVVYAMRVLETWLYGGNPTSALKNRAILNEIRSEMKQGYFEKLIRRYLLKPEHAVTMVLSPSAELAKERLKRECDDAKAYLETLGENGRKANAQKLERLSVFQSAGDTPEALACLPHLLRSDLTREIKRYDMRASTVGSATVHAYTMPTSGISYLRLSFDSFPLTLEELPYLALLSDVLFSCGTGKHSAFDYQNLVMLRMGRLYADTSSVSVLANPDEMKICFTVSSAFLAENYADAYSLIHEGLTETVFRPDEVKKLLLQFYAASESQLIGNGNQYAVKYAGAGINANYYVGDKTKGLSYYRFLKAQCADIDATVSSLSSRLLELLHRVVTHGKMTVMLVGADELEAEYRASPFLFSPATGEKMGVLPYRPFRVSDGVKIPGSVVYNAKVVNLKIPQRVRSGVYNVLSRILSLDYLWNRVRVRGGAYGTSAAFTLGGCGEFSSYRDPSVGGTYRSFDEMPSYVASFDADESEMTKYVIGAVSVLDRPMLPEAEAEQNEHFLAIGYDDETRQRVRDEILSTSAKDIRACATVLKEALDAGNLCTIGAGDKLEAEREMFDILA